MHHSPITVPAPSLLERPRTWDLSQNPGTGGVEGMGQWSTGAMEPRNHPAGITTGEGHRRPTQSIHPDARPARPARRPPRRTDRLKGKKPADWQGRRNYGVVLCSSVHGPGTGRVGDIQGKCRAFSCCNPLSVLQSCIADWTRLCFLALSCLHCADSSLMDDSLGAY